MHTDWKYNLSIHKPAVYMNWLGIKLLVGSSPTNSCHTNVSRFVWQIEQNMKAKPMINCCAI